MTEKELKRLSRADLLEMLIDQSMELQKTQEQLKHLQMVLSSRQIALERAGSIAEASLLLNGVFDAAQAACVQYTENIRLLSERQTMVCQQLEEESRQRAEELLWDAERRCAAMEAETRKECDRWLEQAQKEYALIIARASQEADAAKTPEAESNESLNPPRRRRRRRSEKY